METGWIGWNGKQIYRNQELQEDKELNMYDAVVSWFRRVIYDIPAAVVPPKYAQSLPLPLNHADWTMPTSLIPHNKNQIHMGASILRSNLR